MNSQTKGKVGEREFAALLRDEGFEAWRGAQHSGKGAGGQAAPDVACPSLPGLHFEVKRVEALQLYKAMGQAQADAETGQKPIVAHRKNNCDWVVILSAKDFFAIIRESEEVKQTETTEQKEQ